MVAVNKRAVDLLLTRMEKDAKVKTRSRTELANAPHVADERVAKFSLSYLDAFGYLKDELAQWKDISIGDIVDAVKQFQGFFGLKRDGRLCVKTVRAMEMPRCGCPDINRPRHAEYNALKKFAATNLPKWRKTGLTYAITDYIPGISKTDFESTIYNSFVAWTKHGNIEVNPTKQNSADIVISTGQGRQSNFDGPGGTLAWAYLPDGSDGQLLMKFDLQETWSLAATVRGILLPNVATHEFGHLLGLDHSRIQAALMAAYYNATIAVPQANDDVPRFQARYGIRSDVPPIGTPTGGRVDLSVSNGIELYVSGRKVG